jgi:hypothetical protein
MITIVTPTVPQQTAGRAPVKSFLISWRMMIKLVMRVRVVTRPTPHSLTCTPRRPAKGKVGAVDAGYVALNGATHLAPPDPAPEGEGTV